MAHYTVTQGMRAYGKSYKIGDTVELDDGKARVLVAMGRVTEGAAPVKKPTKKNRSVGLPDAKADAPTGDLETR